MGNPKFRLTSIALDEQENVSAVTAAVSTSTLAVIREFLGDVGWTVLSESESSVTLPAPEMLELFRACGKLSGRDPRYEHSHEIYDSLSRVVYGLIETE